MNLRKLSIVTVLILSQAAALSAYADTSANNESPSSAVVQEVNEQPENEAVTPAESNIPAEEGSAETEPVSNEEVIEQQAISEDMPAEVVPEALNPNELILYFNSTVMVHGGKTYNAPQPMVVQKGVSYVPIRSLVDRVGFKVKYDKTTKETIIIKDSNELRFKTDSSKYTVNGVSKTMKGTSYQTKNTFMVPLTAITQALDISYTVDKDSVGKRVVMDLTVLPTASFTVAPAQIYAGDLVTYTAVSSVPGGVTIVNERWEGRQDVFETPGEYVVTYAVQDSNGNWSEPYTQTIKVLKPNLPPTAMFVTDKAEYKMGEFITITNQSSDDQDEELTYTWDNREFAFFTPGPKTITLTATDKQGLSSTYPVTVNITDETLYSQDDFNRLFIPAGEKFKFSGGEVPSWSKINYSFQDEPSTLIRSNSPETVNNEGIVYRETGVGNLRFMIHHVNNMTKNVKMYVIATNLNAAPAVLRTDYLGFAGPSPIATAAGKNSVLRYFQSMQDGSKYSSVTLQPGESKLVMTELSEQSMKPGGVISLFSDMYSDYPIQFDVIMIDEKADPLAVVDELPLLDRDGVHNRGTYPNSTRVIRYSELAGGTNQRMALGDNLDDPNLAGMDPMYNEVASNTGNFGVLYKITLERVAPNTLISFNPRGGKYSGYAMVNGAITPIYSNGQVSAPDEQAVLYRTGIYEQKVEIILTAAPGSNLPVNLLFTQMPAKK